MPLDVLILAAFAPELTPFGFAASTARVGGSAVALGLVGIGLATAGVGAAHQIAAHEPRTVILVGTCGAYARAGLPIGDVIVATSSRLVDLSAIEGKSEILDAMAAPLEPDRALASALAAEGARPAKVATTLGITVDDGAASRIAERAEVDVEHLETHAVATACASRGVAFAAVLGVANSVGAEGRREWAVHHRQAEAAAARCVMAWLQRAGA
jgi:nucleoside phosphorylase